MVSLKQLDLNEINSPFIAIKRALLVHMMMVIETFKILPWDNKDQILVESEV